MCVHTNNMAFQLLMIFHEKFLVFPFSRVFKGVMTFYYLHLLYYAIRCNRRCLLFHFQAFRCESKKDRQPEHIYVHTFGFPHL